MRFTKWRDRREAGTRLAELLMAHAGSGTLVLGIPRGGIVVAAEVARRLGAELDVMVAARLVAPHTRRVTIGAVTANGGRLLNLGTIRRLRVSEPYVEAITQVQRGAALARENWLRAFGPAAPVTARTVILVDDGMQSGATMRAAVAAVRRRLPARVVVAIPVATRRACALVAAEADELHCLEQRTRITALEPFFVDSLPPTEDEMRELLQRDALQEVTYAG